jgi:hypothetical protein
LATGLENANSEAVAAKETFRIAGQSLKNENKELRENIKQVRGFWILLSLTLNI